MTTIFEYRITNRITKEIQNIRALSAQEACEALGWLIGNCYVENRGASNSQRPIRRKQSIQKGKES